MSLDIIKANRITGQVSIEPTETLFDPVSKMRVSTPSNLIDTDFEYGLQSSKWETLELVNNIPTFFARDGATPLSVASMEAVLGDTSITVTTSLDHNLVVGNVIIVKGSNLAFADGTYAVLTVPSTNTFTYQAKRQSPVTGVINTVSTEIFLGNLYQGTEFKLENLGAITTDGEATSTITVSTVAPHGFKAGTSFILLNSLTSQQITFDSRLIEERLFEENNPVVRPWQTAPSPWGISTYFQNTTSQYDIGSSGMTALVLDDVEDGTYQIQFPAEYQFRFLDIPYDRIIVNANSAVAFSNSSASAPTGATFAALRPIIEVWGNGDPINGTNWTLMNLYYQTTVQGLRVRWEGKLNGDASVTPTFVWELFFDMYDDEIHFKIVTAPAGLDSLDTQYFSIRTPVTAASQTYLAQYSYDDLTNEFQVDFDDPQNQITSKELVISTNESTETSLAVNGYSANAVTFENAGKFVPYRWDAARDLVFKTGITRPTLYFYLGRSADEYATLESLTDTNYIKSIRHNVITFNTAHNLVDRGNYLYNPGMLNDALWIGTTAAAGTVSQANPTVYMVRTAGGTTNLSVGNGIYTFTGSTTSITATSATNNRCTCTSTATFWIGDPVTVNLAIGNLVPGTVYYVRRIISTTQFTLSETLVNGEPGPELTLTTQTVTRTLYIGGIITDPSTQLVLTDFAAPSTCRYVDFGSNTAYPDANQLYGPHAFIHALRVQSYRGIAGNWWVQTLDADYQSLPENQPFTVFTTAPTGTTLSTNNWGVFTPYYVRNPDALNHTSTGTARSPGTRDYETFGTTGSMAAVAANATAITLTVTQANLRDYDAGAHGDLTFDGTANVNITDESITVLNHGLLTGDQIIYNANGNTAIGGLTNAATYFAIRIDDNTIKVATTLANANAGTAINLTAVRTGTHLFTSYILSFDHYVEITNTALNNAGIQYGTVTGHTGTTTRTITITLDYAAITAVAAQTNNVQVRFFGSQSRPNVTFNLSTAVNGGNLNLSGSAFNGYIVPIKYPLSDTEKTFYSKGHGFQNGDLVRYETDNTSYVLASPALATGYYQAEVVSADRFRLLTSTGAQINYTGQGTRGIHPDHYYLSRVPYQTFYNNFGYSNFRKSRSTADWIWSAGAMAANATTVSLTYKQGMFSNTNITLPATNAGSNTFTLSVAQTAITNVIAANSGTLIHGGTIKFYDFDGYDLLLADDSNINDLDIRVGQLTGTTTRSIVCYVLTPGGLPANLGATTTAKFIIDTGVEAPRITSRRSAGSDWHQRGEKWYNYDDNSLKTNLGSRLHDPYDISPYAATTLQYGRITTSTNGAGLQTVAMTVPSNSVALVTADRVDNVSTFVTATPHGFKSGSFVTITGVTNTSFNTTTGIIKAVTPISFTIDQTGANATSANGAASTTVSALDPRSVTITTMTLASPTVVTTPAHGFVTGQAFHFQGIVGTNWGDLWDEKVYYIKVLTTTTFEVYRDRDLTQPLDTSGFTSYVQGTNGGRIWGLGLPLYPIGATHIFNSRSPLLTNDTIYAPGHGLNNATSVVYTTGGGTEIGGLSAGVSKYVRVVSADRFRLADTSDGWNTPARNVSSITIASGTITTVTHGFTTGNLVQYTATGSAITGLVNGAFYYVRAASTTTINLFWNKTAALNNTVADLVNIFGTLPAGTHQFREASIVDLTAEGVGDEHAVTTPTEIGTLDGLYEIQNAAPNGDTSKFTLTNPSNSFVPKRTVALNSSISIDLFNDVIFTQDHGFVTGTPVLYHLGVGSTAISTLTDDTEYYVIKVSNDYFRLALSAFDALSGIHITLNDGNFAGSGAHEFITSSIVGAIEASGTVTASANTNIILGSGTSFASNYRSGDTFYWTYPSVTSGITKTTTFSASTFTSTAHNMSTGLSVKWNSTGSAPTGLVNQYIYYVRYTAANTFQLHPTYADAIANTNAITVSGGSGTHTVTIISTGATGQGVIQYVNSNTRITLTDDVEQQYWHKLPITSISATAVNPSVVTVTFPYNVPYIAGSVISFSGTGNAELDSETYIITSVSNNTLVFTAYSQLSPTSYVNGNTVGMYAYATSPAVYDITSSLLIRSDSASLHRPYDGGVEIVATSAPDSKMIRQTRRYFRYQSGKGIQVSFAINFSPTVGINKITGSGNTATITTRVPHRVTAGLVVTILNDNSDVYNGNFTVATVPDDYTFTITLPSPSNTISTGRPEFYVGNWSDAVLRCGLFDDQNGMFFEYNGSTLSCVRRNSTKQIGGVVSVNFGSNQVDGNDTQFTAELQAGDFIVIKGQSYKITEITNNTLLYIQPSYRGVDSNNVVVSKTEDLKFQQSAWNLDTCDGTGPTGYTLNIHKIQMAYMDYSWYGAGKVRFGFKDADGIVRYVHQIVHNNLETEAYLRSGNLPARYEVFTLDSPTFVPNLAHWGTSVIMDGEFQEDKAYLFSAIANPIYATSASPTTIQVVSARTTNFNSTYIPGGTIIGNDILYAYNTDGTVIGEIGYAFQVENHLDTYYSIPVNASITGATNVVRNGTQAVAATSSRVTAQLGASPYLKDVIIGFNRQGNQNPTPIRRNLLIVNKSPANTNLTNNNTITAALNYDFTQFVPLVSIRLAPSVDSGIAAGLGVREIINRMQLTLQSLDVLATHECEFQLVFNPSLDNLTWQNVASPSLSQVIYHSITDSVQGGSIVYSFLSPAAATQANGSASNAQRELASTTIDLSNVATLGNSILGGDGVYPDGPDVVTLRFRYIGLPGLIGVGLTTGQAVAPFRIGARLSWAESQA